MSRKILIVGSGAREHAIAAALSRSPQFPTLYVWGSGENPGMRDLAAATRVGSLTDGKAISEWAKSLGVDLAVIGPEAPLEAGVSDALWSVRIPVVGPKKTLARLESSKSFTRDLLMKHGIAYACPQFRRFDSMEGVAGFLSELGDLYVIKADGLMGGKGVKVAGDHLHTHQEALAWCEELIREGGAFVIEEKMIGEEFSLISFCGGSTLCHTPPVQDHKRAFEGDTGPNTGGMGSYSDADHSLPFLSRSDVEAAQAINAQVAEALFSETGERYKGMLYGGFMATANGIKVVEYNARFGDPECENLLTLIESDLVEGFNAVVEDSLNAQTVRFRRKASVCKYAVPEGYPDRPLKGFRFSIERVRSEGLYLGAVDIKDGVLVGTGSRTVAVVCTGNTLAEAEAKAEREICKIEGPLFHRTDVGTEALIARRVEHMRALRG
ncbi:MAG: phosphoribosylamine--glycine ligase [Opitutales bacterium]|nr:phosphoribosylamine--glycine ligase [Opitutales bacterium]